ncbi:MAG: 16S rRNA (guanine(966)-N(2))-methyltransferase RsmD [Bacteroidota bacterium]
MRIISGKYKGRRIEVSKKLKARPTTDFAKENLFNVLTNQIDFDNLKVLDLYAGTGSISFEFISRGAARVDCVEMNQEHVKVIHKTRDTIGIDNLFTFRYPAVKYLNKAVGQYNLIFADPPYESPDVKTLPALVFESEILEEGGLFILEHSGKYSFNSLPGFKELRKYGSVHFSFFKK